MEHAHANAHRLPSSVKDPVCGMDVDPAATPHHYALGDTEYYFCSKGCLEKFKANPGEFTQPVKAQGGCCHGHATPAPSARPAAGKGSIYTCPMHPEVRQIGPGTCPKCGMALEPENIAEKIGRAHV